MPPSRSMTHWNVILRGRLHEGPKPCTGRRYGAQGRFGSLRLGDPKRAAPLSTFQLLDVHPTHCWPGSILPLLVNPHVRQERKEETMPLYLSKFSYTPETWARLISNPEDRAKAAQAYIESVGGKLHGFWYAFGAHDGYNLWEAPDNVSMAAVALAISGGGALNSFETTVLVTVGDTMEALRKAEQIKYRPPGA
jgi:uncharacterized protein with GYD domain